MSFKVNSSLSKPSCVNGGSPQGTKLGNFLFIVTINAVEDGHDFVPPAIEDPEDDGEDIFDLANWLAVSASCDGLTAALPMQAPRENWAQRTEFYDILTSLGGTIAPSILPRPLHYHCRHTGRKYPHGLISTLMT